MATHAQVSIDALPSAFPQETRLRRGLCPISTTTTTTTTKTELDTHSHSIYYEQHGVHGTNPKHKLVFIMGLNASCWSWFNQIRHFTRNKADWEGDGYTALVFDNRGVGYSGYPRGPYSTSAMAEDVICLLDRLGWTQDRELNVIGMSLGGMIAQELAYRIPHRICSLILAVTKPGGFPLFNFPPLKGLLALSKLFLIPTDIHSAISLALETLFTPHWLQQPAKSTDKNTNERPKTNYQVQKEGMILRSSFTKRQLITGTLSQMVAALTHNVSPSRLAYIAANIPKIVIVTGDQDNFVHPSGSESIKASMDTVIDPDDEQDAMRVELVKWEGIGHGVHIQSEARFNDLIERCVNEGRSLIESGWKVKIL